MKWLVAALFLVVALSGCVEDEPDQPTVTTEQTADGGNETDDLLSYEVDPDNETQLDGAHIHDEWGAATELILFEGTVSTDDCVDPIRGAFITAAGAFFGQEVRSGCALFRLGEDQIVPEGTGELWVEVDATDALLAGGMQLFYDNDAIRFTPLEETQDTSYQWVIPVEPIEWDLPHSTETVWQFFVQGAGQVAIMNGEIDVTIAAQRVPDWEPILGSAHIDHWDIEAMNTTHDFIRDDVMRVLDTNVTVSMQSWADRLTSGFGGGNQFGSSYDLDDIIAPETSQVTLAIQWAPVQGCPPGHECWVVPFLSAANSSNFNFDDPVETGEDWAIYVFDVPEPLSPDSTYATESSYQARAFVRACPNGDSVQAPIPFFTGCFGEAAATMTADTRIEIENWKGQADVADLKTRLGFA